MTMDMELQAPSRLARLVDNCIEFGFNHAICCSACLKFADSVNVLIDDRDHDEAMAIALSARAMKHRSDRFKCKQLWKLLLNDQDISMAVLNAATRQKDFINKHRGRADRLEQVQVTPRRSLEASFTTPTAGPTRVTPDPPSTPPAIDSQNESELIGDDDDPALCSPSRAPAKGPRTTHKWNQ